MIFACKNCGAKYKVPEEKISGRKFKSRCKKCGGWIFIVAMPSKVKAKTVQKKQDLIETTQAKHNKNRDEEPTSTSSVMPSSSQIPISTVPGSRSSIPVASKKYWLRIVGGESAGVQFPLPADGTCIIGSNSKADITLSDDVVSRKHAKITVQGDTVSLEDLGSTNGTFVNGTKITKTSVSTDDAILVGLTILNLVKEGGPDSFRESLTSFDSSALSDVEDKAWPNPEHREDTRRFAQFALAVIQGANKGAKFSLPLDSGVIVGAGRNADIALDDDVASRKHAQVWVQDGRVQVTDLGSTNGTYLNGKRIQRATLSTADQLLIGRTVLQIVDLSG